MKAAKEVTLKIWVGFSKEMKMTMNQFNDPIFKAKAEESSRAEMIKTMKEYLLTFIKNPENMRLIYEIEGD